MPTRELFATSRSDSREASTILGRQTSQMLARLKFSRHSATSSGIVGIQTSNLTSSTEHMGNIFSTGKLVKTLKITIIMPRTRSIENESGSVSSVGSVNFTERLRRNRRHGTYRIFRSVLYRATATVSFRWIFHEAIATSRFIRPTHRISGIVVGLAITGRRRARRIERILTAKTTAVLVNVRHFKRFWDFDVVLTLGDEDLLRDVRLARRKVDAVARHVTVLSDVRRGWRTESEGPAVECTRIVDRTCPWREPKKSFGKIGSRNRSKPTVVCLGSHDNRSFLAGDRGWTAARRLNSYLRTPDNRWIGFYPTGESRGKVRLISYTPLQGSHASIDIASDLRPRTPDRSYSSV